MKKQTIDLGSLKGIRGFTSKEERDLIRFNKDTKWLGSGFCFDCNKPVSRERYSLRCRSCALKEVHKHKEAKK